MLPYNENDKNSIVEYAKKLKDKSLRESCNTELLREYTIRGRKGVFGQVLEKCYFLYNPNSDSEPDFAAAKLELKSTPLKKLQNKQLKSKERLVLNIINYHEVATQSFETSSFWKKNANILLVAYLYNSEKDILDYIIKLVGEWVFSEVDLKIIKQDWKLIQNKILDGKAHELSEGDTLYLGACTKGANAKTTREQPHSDIKAKQRAYSLKQGYVNHILASIAGNSTEIFGKLIESVDAIEHQTLEELVVARFIPYYNKTIEEILTLTNTQANRKSKNFYSILTKVILGVELGNEIEEFKKADIEVKTIRLDSNGLPKEDISFPSFKYNEIIKEDWEESKLKAILESKFLFVFFQYTSKDNLILKKVKFWNMPYSDILEVKKVWSKTKDVIASGKIVREIIKTRRYTNFPNKDFNKVAHVRPHAQNSNDTYPLPVNDELTGNNGYMKHCFWLNNSYVSENIYKD